MPSTAEQHLNFCDAVAFGRWFLANPDLPQRIKVRCCLNFDSEVQICVFFWRVWSKTLSLLMLLVEVGAPLNHYKRATFYTHEAQILGPLELLISVCCLHGTCSISGGKHTLRDRKMVTLIILI